MSDDDLESTSLNTFIYSWSFCDEETDEGLRCFIRAYGISTVEEKKESKKSKLDIGYQNVYVLIENFPPYCYIELPSIIDNHKFEWDETNVKFLYDKLSNLGMKKDMKPINYKFVHKKKLYFANKHKKKENGKYVDKLFPFLFLTFNSMKALSYFGYRLKKPIDVYGIGRNITFKTHEGDYSADPVMKMTAIRKIKLAGWVNIVGKEIFDQEKESRFDREIVCTYKNIKKADIKSVVMPKIMCFDGEMNSQAIRAMPNSKLDSDKVFQISCVFSRNKKYDIESNNYYEKILLTLGNPDPIDDSEIRKFKNEGDLLLGFKDLINEKNPNVCIGYNIFGFDIEYMWNRAKHCMVEKEFLQNSCLFNKPAYIHDKDKWASQAFGKQNIIRFESEGRLFFDVCPFIKRNYKLVNYKLSTVAEKFKVGEKDPLKPKDIFRCYREFTGPSLHRVGYYCIRDSVVATRIWEKINMWISLVEECGVNRVPIITLYTKGQQIKMYSQVYEYCMYHNYIVESNGYVAKDDEHYTGALVLDAITGLYKKVVSLDFASLYPSIMISHNIDYSTCVLDDNIPDEDCHVFKWSEHVNCEHDRKYVEKEEKKRIRKEKIAKNKEEKEKKKQEKEKKEKKKEIDRLKKIINKVKKEKPKADEDKSDLDFLDETDSDTEYIRANLKDRNTGKRKDEIKIENEDKKLLSTVKIDMDGKKVESEDDRVSSIKKVCGHFHYRFLKHEVSEKGVLPSLLENLLSARKATRKVLKEITDIKIPNLKKEITEMKNNKEKMKKEEEMEEMETECIVLDKRQLNYKVSANSMYGAMGVKKGYLPFLPGAMCVTYVGRRSIGITVDIVKNHYKGKIIYGDTDSIMVVFETEDLKELGIIARKISEHSTRVFPAPMKLEYEGKIYHVYLLFSKKRYVLLECDEEGTVNPELKSKGIVLSRRDNSKFLKQLYQSTIEHIFNEKSLPEVLLNIVNYIDKLFARHYSYKDFVITKGLTRDDYKVKPAHAILADKMRERGITVQVGSKIAYIITTEGGNKYNVRQKDKIEDEDYFAEWREILRVDFLYLFEKQAIKPIDEILETVYNVFKTTDISFMKQQFNFRKQKEKFVKCIEEYGKPVMKFIEKEEVKEPIIVKNKKVLKLNKS
jgi:DNA polymerase elongation subunit (family B)